MVRHIVSWGTYEPPMWANLAELSRHTASQWQNHYLQNREVFRPQIRKLAEERNVIFGPIATKRKGVSETIPGSSVSVTMLSPAPTSHHVTAPKFTKQDRLDLINFLASDYPKDYLERWRAFSIAVSVRQLVFVILLIQPKSGFVFTMTNYNFSKLSNRSS
ncbi:hypothetical protein BS47DRAFT_1216821 [Hydnum rufescens UP504]|uniref:Uncharacterized protein n=1 Tax=Hydnum rufescens UP504 TaxID=1448309 RepID=A0A9P6DRD7_9AGAM|nr:hypothetical protein BS47DRAFT_1216821 [Hydnum rufescens UP504]